jgi:hypothetical protein
VGFLLTTAHFTFDLETGTDPDYKRTAIYQQQPQRASAASH